MKLHAATLGIIGACGALFIVPALAQVCQRQGANIDCGDGRTGILEGEAILWPDGTRSSLTPHPSVRIGQGVRIGPGVMTSHPSGAGVMPLDDPDAPMKKRCAIVDSLSYCH